jgi:hypothetical protein
MRQGEVLGVTMPHLRLLVRELLVEQQCRHLFPDANEETTRAPDAHYRAALLRRSHRG